MEGSTSVVLNNVRNSDRAEVAELLAEARAHVSAALGSQMGPPRPPGPVYERLDAANRGMERELLVAHRHAKVLQAELDEQTQQLEAETLRAETLQADTVRTRAQHAKLHKSRLHPLLRQQQDQKLGASASASLDDNALNALLVSDGGSSSSSISSIGAAEVSETVAAATLAASVDADVRRLQLHLARRVQVVSEALSMTSDYVHRVHALSEALGPLADVAP